MNKIFLILTLLFVSTIQSQNIERNDLIGEWVFKVNIKDVIKNFFKFQLLCLLMLLLGIDLLRALMEI